MSTVSISFVASTTMTIPLIKVYDTYLKKKDRLIEYLELDHLTHLMNRHSFNMMIDKLINDNAYEPQSMAVILFDIDKFKHINDTYGHLAGDAVLEEIGELFRDSIRHGDIVSRYGGEEFLMLLLDSNFYDATQIAERIRVHLSSQVYFREKLIQWTVSAGMYWTEIGNLHNITTYIESADIRLYDAKCLGRNRLISSCHLT